MTTQQAIEALHALPRMGKGEPGLARMQNLCDHLGNPEKELQCIHIAGTNGKGSLAAMTSSILTAAGYKTGLTISPYVVDFRERFQIDGEMIPPRTLAGLTQKVMDAIDAIVAEGGEKPVFDPEAPNQNPVEAGPAVAPKDESGKFDPTKIAEASDFGDWEEQGCKG
jgi:dihydrofolate synthase/folylpolyglutamate synthase